MRHATTATPPPLPLSNTKPLHYYLRPCSALTPRPKICIYCWEQLAAGGELELGLRESERAEGEGVEKRGGIEQD